MGLLQHMAMVTHNNRRLARFYHYVFGMEEVWNVAQLAPHAYYIGDGYFQINCLQIWSGISYMKMVDGKSVYPDPEINHVGFLVKSLEETENRFKAWGTPIKTEKSPVDGRYEEWRFTDPDGNLFELARGHWDAGRKQGGMSPIGYIGINSPDPERLADFYKNTLEMKEANRERNPATGTRSVYLTDGTVCFGISGKEGVKAELTSVGFKVDSIEEIKNRLTTSPPFLFVGEPPLAVVQRPATGLYKGANLKDPDGNTVELSEEGWL